MARKYHTMLTRDDDQSPWTIEFGAYDRDDVLEEQLDYRNRGWKAKNLKIITTGPRQAHIQAAVSKLNGTA